MRPGTKAFDAPVSKKDTVSGLATEVAQKVMAARKTEPDPDDASETAGALFRIYLEDLMYDTKFIQDVNQQIGGNFNSEFFLDGLFGGSNA